MPSFVVHKQVGAHIAMMSHDRVVLLALGLVLHALRF